MATNPETGIDFEVDRFVKYRVSTDTVESFQIQWPRFDGGPIVGLNPDYKFYKRQSTPHPQPDHRFTVNTTWEMVDTDPTPPDGHPAGVYLQKHEVVKLPKEDLKIQVEAAFQHQLQLHFPQVNNPAVLLASADAIIRRQAGSPLTDAQEAILDDIQRLGDVVAQLSAARAAFFTDIDNEVDYDITDRWPAVPE